jgi:membrane fusion protein, copper/silver efflux system
MTKARKAILSAALLGLVAVGVVWTACRRSVEHSSQATAQTAVRYQCPMHPTYVADKPGACPICGMGLVPMAPQGPAAAPTSAGPRRVAYYRSPMDPAVRSATPAKDSMGMDFLPVYEDELQPGGAVPGRATITLSPERRRVLGLRSAAVQTVNLQRILRTVGRVTADERRLHHVHTKFEGYVEKLFVDFVGKEVRRGEPLVSIFSPELVATQEEYLLALRARERLASGGIDSVAQGGADLVDAAKRRLLLWDIRQADIERLERTGQVRRTLDLYSDVDGYVVEKHALQGMRITPSETLFDIADLSHLWVLADVYESDLPAVRLGMTADVTVAHVPDRTWTGAVTWVAPTVEEKTRTVKVRVEVDNRDRELKPEMFADVVLKTDLGSGLVVPDNALVQSGTRTLVFVDRGDGTLEPREIQVGAKTAEGVQVRRGLIEGERVVTSANFLLDSESSLKAALTAMAPSQAPAAPAHQH